MDYDGTGMSFMELSHRDADGPVQKTIQGATDKLRALLDVPANYHIILWPVVTMRSLPLCRSTCWETRRRPTTLSQGWRFRKPRSLATRVVPSTVSLVTILPLHPSTWNVSKDSAFAHIRANETIHGLEFLEDPELPSGSPPLVGDFTSTLLSRPIDLKKYGMIYASGGKKLGPAGVTVVIIRDDLVGKQAQMCPSVLSYQKVVHSKPISSIYNTPPTFNIYMVYSVLQDKISSGGMAALKKRAIRRANAIHKLMDESTGFYVPKCTNASFASRMNVPFRIGDSKGNAALEKL